jgi:hypothetical protein
VWNRHTSSTNLSSLSSCSICIGSHLCCRSFPLASKVCRHGCRVDTGAGPHRWDELVEVYAGPSQVWRCDPQRAEQPGAPFSFTLKISRQEQA